ncbi:DUF5615 family PIN-like protein [Marivita sp. S6314]|uniref:DUF5615 family PIN-like protein n=1 Tax=Marivita sp. S6314 TaxID=2926406 RepID=UPI001FF117FB|nr:DUF5615 family PIN-like protein [Marivita sp. S6314]MCK0149026.1 DUF5615 family PIN-like protein [Marivita sp. S6314]
MKFFLDAQVPFSVGSWLTSSGHETIFHNDALPEGTVDDVVCATAILNEAILVALDKDMKRAVRRYGSKLQQDRFKSLDLLLFVCSPVQAEKRLQSCFSLVEHEWKFANKKKARRMWVEIGTNHLRTYR